MYNNNENIHPLYIQCNENMMMNDIDDERLYNLYLEMDKTDFIEYLNKEIFHHIQGEF